MKAAILRAINTPMTIEDVDLDQPRADEVRLRVVASGLCHSDYHSMVGDMPYPMPVVMGHEASGIVEAVGEDVRGLKRGDRVVTCISMHCGQCRECQTGHNYVCSDKPLRAPGPGSSRITKNGEHIHQYGQLGGFAEEMLVHHSAVTKIPDDMPLDLAALLGCAVLTGVGAATECAQVRPGSLVVVIGCGGVGLNVIQGARLAGAARIIAVDTNPAKFALARTFGATDCAPGGEGAVEAVLELTKGGVDYAFEVIGVPAAQRQGLAMLRRRGKLVLVGLAPMGSTLDVPSIPITAREFQIVGSLMGSVPFQQAVPAYAQLYLDGRLILDPLVSQRIRLEDINTGYDQLIAGETARSVIIFDS